MTEGPDEVAPDGAAPDSPAAADRLVLAAAAADWDRLGPLLDAEPEVRDRLAALLTAYRGSSRPGRFAAEAARLLREALPAEFGDGAAGRLVPTAPAGAKAPSVRGFVAEDLVVLLVDGHRMAGPVLGAVRDRLLAEPAVAPDTVGARGPDPGGSGLIRLPGPGGRPRLPLFQFDEGLSPRSVVLDVNRLLGADADPWGVADWWLSGNAWLGTAPARLLGSGQDGRLLDAARLLKEAD
ncbi:hypothetical protein [Streptomyces sp. 8L]|uniref:hypothetical protein n=1 Tax=Streptomyces sp. 8L TaxID=2877242 RepID=UPI001CD2BB5F|nr:hypothetical protein [Streptomyces sp. 8L]MCA1219539.1 hypothetical protein [Streptomyces sp. 8L]